MPTWSTKSTSLTASPCGSKHLRTFLAKFDVALGFDDAGIVAVSAWMPQYADWLVRNFNDDVTRKAYRGFSVPWTEELAGLNPIFDLGIYYAECLWLRRTKLKWIVTRGPQQEVSAHFISGLPGNGKPFSPMTWTYVHCRHVRISKARLQKRVPFADAS